MGIKDEKYLNFIRSKPCSVCQTSPSDPHHLVSRGAGGSDYQTVPLCREHHSEYHQRGEAAFEERYRQKVWRVCANLLIEWAIHNKVNPFDLARAAASESSDETDQPWTQF